MDRQTERQLQEVIDLLESRGISMEQKVEVLQEMQSTHTDLSFAEAEAAIINVLTKPVVQESLFTGLELDRLTEEKKISEPLRKIIQSDEPLFGIDETLALVPLLEEGGLTAFSELGHRDIHKIGIINQLDSSKDHVNTFSDDQVTMVDTMADGDLIEGKRIQVVPADLSVAQSTSANNERQPLSAINKKVKSRVPTEVVQKAAIQRLEERDLIERIADAVFSKQHDYNPLLNAKATQQQEREVLGLGGKELRRNPHAREIYHAILVLTELEELANHGELCEPLMRRIEAHRTNFRPSRGIALLATGLNGSIAMTRNGYSTQHPYPSLPQPTAEGPINLFTVDTANMLVSNVMARTAHTQRFEEEKVLQRLQYGVGNAVHTGRNKVKKALNAGKEVTSKVIKPMHSTKDKRKGNRIQS